jgi:hypothetical protein
VSTIQLSVGEIEVSIYANRNEYAGLVCFGDSAVDVEYEFEPGQPLILRPDPDDSQPGSPDAVTIGAIKTVNPMEFIAGGLLLTVDAGEDIFHLLSKQQIEQLEDESLSSLKEEACA